MPFGQGFSSPAGQASASSVPFAATANAGGNLFGGGGAGGGAGGGDALQKIFEVIKFLKPTFRNKNFSIGVGQGGQQREQLLQELMSILRAPRAVQGPVTVGGGGGLAPPSTSQITPVPSGNTFLGQPINPLLTQSATAPGVQSPFSFRTQ